MKDIFAAMLHTAGLAPAPSIPLLDLLREYIIRYSIEEDLSEATKEKYEFMYNHVSRFVNEKYPDLQSHEVRIMHMDEFKYWLKINTVSETQEHISRHLRLCRSALDYAVNAEHIPFNRISSLKLKKDPSKQTVSLDRDELRKFIEFKSDNRLHAYVVHLFLFQCYTGVSFMDIWLFQLKDEVVVVGDKKVTITMITCERGRGKSMSKNKLTRIYWAEFMPEARHILELYGEFPSVHVQTYNRVIQKIAKSLGITKHITTHIGRKTFATLKRTEGYSMPAVADMLGNTEKVARTSYVSRSKELVLNEIIKLKFT